ncbi:MAG: hypothetical protein BGO78_16535 [Chloroflexi bacterium 44-23]|nr:MAG: hypothetical protein BGO78_16535 [Chloroflexi bacterium 44-23]
MKKIIEKYEIYFWDTLTAAMANSRLIQKTIRIAYPIFQGIDLKKMIKAITISGFSGFATGWAIYYILLMIQN